MFKTGDDPTDTSGYFLDGACTLLENLVTAGTSVVDIESAQME